MDNINVSFIFSSNELVFLFKQISKRYDLCYLIMQDCYNEDEAIKSLKQNGLLVGNNVDPVVGYLLKSISSSLYSQKEDGIIIDADMFQLYIKRYNRAENR